MVLSTIKGGLRKLFIDVPIGLYFWLTGVFLIAGWKIPEKLGSDFASKGVSQGQTAMKRGKDRMSS